MRSTPSNVGTALVRCFVSGNGVEYGESLAGSIDRVVVGMPYEYAVAARDGALFALEQAGEVACGLTIAWAAHGEAYSSGYLFERLARFVAQAILRGTNEQAAFQELATKALEL